MSGTGLTQLNDHPVVYTATNAKDAIAHALEHATLNRALHFITLWEMDRIVRNVEKNPGKEYESCFGYLHGEVRRQWEEKHKPIIPSAMLNYSN